MRILVDFFCKHIRKLYFFTVGVGWNKENKLKEAVDSRDVALILFL